MEGRLAKAREPLDQLGGTITPTLVASHPTRKIFMKLLTSLPVPILHGLALSAGGAALLTLGQQSARPERWASLRFDTMPSGIKVAWRIAER